MPASKKRANRSQIWLVVALTLILVLLIAVIWIASRGEGGQATDSSLPSGSEVESQSSLPSDSSSSKADSSSELSSEESVTPTSEPETPEEADRWRLRLANSENPLPADFTVETAAIRQEFARDTGMQFDARAVSALNEMCEAAKADGVRLLVISSYRTVARQTTLYNNEVQEWLAQGYTSEQAKEAAATVVAVPGTSEHNLGLAVDFNSVEETFEGTPQYLWLRANAEQFGFVLRYPKDKQSVTGIIYEPWHYRYVGVEHAQKMKELGLCLEEYLEWRETQ